MKLDLGGAGNFREFSREDRGSGGGEECFQSFFSTSTATGEWWPAVAGEGCREGSSGLRFEKREGKLKTEGK